MNVKMKQRSVLFSLAILAVVIGGLYFDNEFWRRVSLGFVWVMSILGILVGFAMLPDNEKAEELRVIYAKRPTWRKWLVGLLDVPIIILLAGHGYWWAFGFFTTQAIMSASTEIKATEEQSVEDSKS